jgi:hypothetical protein
VSTPKASSRRPARRISAGRCTALAIDLAERGETARGHPSEALARKAAAATAAAIAGILTQTERSLLPDGRPTTSAMRAGSSEPEAAGSVAEPREGDAAKLVPWILLPPKTN